MAKGETDVASPPAASIAAGRATRVGALVQSPWFAAAVGGLCFLNSLFNGFTYDDVAIVRDNPRVRDIANVRGIWLSDWWQPQTEQEQISERFRDRLYRPLTMFSFALNYAFHGLASAGFHLLNVLLHALACWLVWTFAQRLFANPAASTICALLFAVHPVHSEAVANVVGRAEILTAIFLLLGLIALMPERGAQRPAGVPPPNREDVLHPTPARIALAALAFFAAVLSKETAVCYPLLALIVLYARHRFPLLRAPDDPPPKAAPTARSRPAASQSTAASTASTTLARSLIQSLILLAPLAVYLPLRYHALDGHLLRDRAPSNLLNPLIEADAAQRLVTPIAIAGEYLRILIVPNDLCSDYGLGTLNPTSALEFRVVMGAVAFGALIYALFGSLSRSPDWQRASVASALAIASYLLISNTFLLIGVSLAERLMYWPTVPIFLLIAVLFAAGWRRYCLPGKAYASSARGALWLAGLFLVAFGLRAIFRNADWLDNRTLFLADVNTHPNGVLLNIGAAHAVLDPAKRETFVQAETFLRRSLSMYQQNPNALASLAEIEASLGKRKLAIEHVEAALLVDPLNASARRLLALLNTDSAASEKRIDVLRQAATTRPSDPDLLTELVGLLRDLGRQPEAHAEIQRVADLAPNDARIQYLWAQSLISNNQASEALPILQHGVELDPSNWAAHANLSALLAGTDPKASLEHARKAQELQPAALETNVNLAEALAANGQIDQSIELWKRILASPSLPEGSPKRDMLVRRLRELEQTRR